MRKLGLVLALFAAACGDDDAPSVNHVEDPEILPRGGIGSGAIQGELNVFVVDSVTSAPIAGATVRVEAEPEPLTGNTDSTGLIVFTDSGLAGAQTVTAQATDYANSTWIGANGAVLTIPLESNDPTPVTPTSYTVAATIDGFADIPVTAGHAILGLILYSYNPDFEDPANSIEQGTRTIMGGTEIPANACIKVPVGSDCNAQVETRAGAQALWGLIFDVTNIGQPDQTMTLIGYTLLRGLDVNADITTVQTLDYLETAELDEVTVTWGTPPTGLAEQKGMPVLNLGDEGWIIAAYPTGLTNDVTALTVPALSGALATDATYDIIAMADPDQADGATDITFPQSMLYRRTVDISATIALDNWMTPPSAITVTAGTYSFTGAVGATVHTCDFYGIDGDKYWGVGIFDGSTEFTLPDVTPGLPVGTVSLSVGAMEVPGLSVTDFNLEAVMDAVTRMANNQIDFTH
jgi:hypothetical protein